MNTTEQKIGEAYKKMIKKLRPPAGESGVVKSVDEGTQTAEVELTLHDEGQNVTVLLNATPESDMGIIVYPAVDSDVVICDVDGEGIYTIVRYGKIDKVVVKTGDVAEMVITEGQIVMNGGSNGGLVIVSELVGKINAIEELLNSLINNYNSHTHLYAPGPGVPVPTDAITPLTGGETGSITPLTAVADIENENVQH